MELHSMNFCVLLLNIFGKDLVILKYVQKLKGAEQKKTVWKRRGMGGLTVPGEQDTAERWSDSVFCHMSTAFSSTV